MSLRKMPSDHDIVGKGKMLVTSMFSFSNQIFYFQKQFKQTQPFYLTLSQTTNFRLFQTEKACRRQFQIC